MSFILNKITFNHKYLLKDIGHSVIQADITLCN